MDFTPGELFAGSVVSAIGVGVFIYGRKQRRPPQFLAGVLLMLCPFVGGGGWMVSAAGAAIVCALWLALRFGM